MQANEIMIKEVYKVKESDNVRSVIKKFIDNRISGVPVVNDRNEIVAYVSDGDIMRYIGNHHDSIIDNLVFVTIIREDDKGFIERTQKLLNLNIMEIAQRKVITVTWDEKIENIATTLGKKRIKKLPVEQNGVLVGIISRGDVIRHSFKTIL